MFVLQDRKTATQLDSFRTYAEAERTLKEYEEQDRYDGMYEPDYYEIREV